MRALLALIGRVSMDVVSGFHGCLRMVAAAAAAALIVGCDDAGKLQPRPAPSVAPASPSSIASVLGLDAGAFVDTADPPAPAGDLKADLDRFVNVEGCVKERANVDPLVGDGLRAIGYDTFLRDACRLLEAAKDKKRETCDRIDSSSMRARCQSWVALVAQTARRLPAAVRRHRDARAQRDVPRGGRQGSPALHRGGSHRGPRDLRRARVTRRDAVPTCSSRPIARAASAS